MENPPGGTNMTTAAIRTLLFATLLLSPLAAAEDIGPTKFNEATVADLQAQMAAGTLTSVELTNFYITRILVLDQKGPGVNAVIELNPDALSMARDAYARRGVRALARHPCTAQGQHRHWRQDADYRRLLRALRDARFARFHDRRKAAGGWR